MKKVEVFDYANDILKALKSGVLVTTKTEEKVNTMTISWGSLGVEWNKPIFITYVRENRFTKEQLENHGEFTVNIPLGEFNKKILGVAGVKSGRDVDKISELGLTLVDGEAVDVPGIKELPLTLECKVIYSQLQDSSAISEEDKKVFYPDDVDSSHHSANKDYHIMYYGEIVNAYIIED